MIADKNRTMRSCDVQDLIFGSIERRFVDGTSGSYSIQIGLQLKGCRMGRSDTVSLWYVSLLINTRFRFLVLE